MSTRTLELLGIAKRYGGVHALRGADLTISHPGVVHGLVGANGSGKSTMLGILSGQIRPDDGIIAIDGQVVHLHSPRGALRHGVAMVSQETALAPELSIAENVFLGHRLARRHVRGIDWARSIAQTAELLAELGVDEDPRTEVRRLRPDRAQLVEIARALSLQTRFLILDEPTSSLDDHEVRALSAVIRRLRDRGVVTILVSHRLSELTDLCDELTILRDGRTVAQGPIAAFDRDRILEKMVGHTPAGRPDAEADAPRSVVTGPPVLRLHDVSVEGAVDRISLDVAPGQILGLAGVVGSGRSRLLAAIFGALPVTGGTIEVDGYALRGRGPREAIARGIGYLPPDRKTSGLVLLRSVAENLSIVATRDRWRLGRPRPDRERALLDEATRRMHIRASDPDVAVSALSGGNQQKVALGKWLFADPRVLLLDEPTRGVDIAAKQEIHELLREIAADGVALVVSSSETDELLEICDAVAVMHRGRIDAVLDGDRATDAAIAHYAGGAV